MTHRSLVLALVALSACGPRQPGAVANQTYFWKVVSSSIEFGTCSDEATFRKGLTPVAFQADSYLIYKVEKDGKTAVSQSCTELDPSTCKPSTMKVIYTVAGAELVFTSDNTSPITNSTCALRDTITWLLTDLGSTATLDISHVLSLVEPAPPVAPSCADADTQIKAASPNKLGIEGCVVTFKIGLAWN